MNQLQKQQLEREVSFSFARSSGPGGQNVNKVNSKAILHWNYLASAAISEQVRQRFLQLFGERIAETGDVTISNDTSRDQLANKSACIEKLHKMIAAAEHVPKKRLKTKPTRASVEKRLKEKSRHSEKKISRRLFD